jgi:hypothetical protein
MKRMLGFAFAAVAVVPNAQSIRAARRVRVYVFMEFFLLVLPSVTSKA